MTYQRNSYSKVQTKLDKIHGMREYELLHYKGWSDAALFRHTCGFEFTKSPKVVAYPKIHCPQCQATRFKRMYNLEPEPNEVTKKKPD